MELFPLAVVFKSGTQITWTVQLLQIYRHKDISKYQDWKTTININHDYKWKLSMNLDFKGNWLTWKNVEHALHPFWRALFSALSAFLQSRPSFCQLHPPFHPPAFCKKVTSSLHHYPLHVYSVFLDDFSLCNTIVCTVLQRSADFYIQSHSYLAPPT